MGLGQERLLVRTPNPSQWIRAGLSSVDILSNSKTSETLKKNESSCVVIFAAMKTCVVKIIASGLILLNDSFVFELEKVSNHERPALFVFQRVLLLDRDVMTGHDRVWCALYMTSDKAPGSAGASLSTWQSLKLLPKLLTRQSC